MCAGEVDDEDEGAPTGVGDEPFGLPRPLCSSLPILDPLPYTLNLERKTLNPEPFHSTRESSLLTTLGEVNDEDEGAPSGVGWPGAWRETA